MQALLKLLNPDTLQPSQAQVSLLAVLNQAAASGENAKRGMKARDQPSVSELHLGFMHSASLNSSPETKHDLSPTPLPSSYLSVRAVTMYCGLPEGKPLSFHRQRAEGTGTCSLLSTASMGIPVLHGTCMTC